ncbi:MAG: Dyp-type peroxidase [Acetobacteraceae bacterium]
MAGADLTASSARIPDAADIQALLVAGYGTLTEATFLLLQIADAAAARAWLAAAPVTAAADLAQRLDTAVQVAVSARGLRALGVDGAVVAGFAPEFLSGMAGDEGRSRRLGDVGPSAPSSWLWGATGEPDLLLMLYSVPGGLDALRDRVTHAAFHRGFRVVADLAASDMMGREPFGFLDGVSQPRIDWNGMRQVGTAADLGYGNLIAPGEFVLGRRNEYGLYTERPLLDPAQADGLPTADDDPTRRDLGRNGTYLVLRELSQDVRGFWRFMADTAGAAGADALAETMVGRRLSGDALVPLGTQPIPGLGPDQGDITRNQFTYETDQNGLRCPFGAHVRRANPRTGDMPGGRQGRLSWLIRTLGFDHANLRQDLVASSRFHRVLRRGRPFGAPMSRQEALRPDAADPAGGLHFICLGANIARQFEFVQNAWLSSAKFNGLSGESDPVTGNRAPFPPGQVTDGFGMPQQNGATRRIAGLHQFVTVRGGGYFFLPGLRALRYFAR